MISSDSEWIFLSPFAQLGLQRYYRAWVTAGERLVSNCHPPTTSKLHLRRSYKSSSTDYTIVCIADIKWFSNYWWSYVNCSNCRGDNSSCCGRGNGQPQRAAARRPAAMTTRYRHGRQQHQLLLQLNSSNPSSSKLWNSLVQSLLLLIITNSTLMLLIRGGVVARAGGVRVRWKAWRGARWRGSDEGLVGFACFVVVCCVCPLGCYSFVLASESSPSCSNFDSPLSISYLSHKSRTILLSNHKNTVQSLLRFWSQHLLQNSNISKFPFDFFVR